MSHDGRGIGGRVRRLRQLRGLTLSALARKSGISKAYLSQLENDASRNPSVEIVAQLSQALEVPVSELLGIDHPEAVDRESLPVGLRIFWAEHPELTLEDVRVLASLHYRGARPLTATDYWLIYQTLRLAVTRHFHPRKEERRLQDPPAS